MARVLYGTVILVVWAALVTPSLQLEDGGMGCEISSGLGLADDLNYTLSAVETCDVGTIAWHYPMGTLTVKFPRALIGDVPRKYKLKVCFRGELGEGVSHITQSIARRKRTTKHRIPLVDSMTEWRCSRPSRSPEGVTVTLVSTSLEGPRYYLKVIKYKAVAETKIGKPRGKGNRRGKDRKGRKKDRRQNKNDRMRSRPGANTDGATE